MRILDKLIFKKRLKTIGIIAEDNTDRKIVDALLKINNTPKKQKYLIKCMKETVKTIKLQEICEKLGRKDAGRYLELKPIVIQCHSCHINFSTKKRYVFVKRTTYKESLAKIIEHLISCKEIICDCGRLCLYFDDCKCGLKWNERSVNLMHYRKDYPFTKKQRDQINKYKLKVKAN